MEMEDLMARTMVENLSIGIDPRTGLALGKGDCCADPVVQEALKMVLEHCSLESYGSILERQRREKKEAKKAKKAQKAETKERYPAQGEEWTTQEEWKLLALHNNGYSVPHIANILKRSPGAIRARLKKLGKLR